MRPRVPLISLTLMLVMVTGCFSGSTTTTLDAVSDSREAAEVVEALLAAVDGGDFAGAAALTLTEQLAWVVMAEGGTLNEAAGLLDEGLDEVAANYWQGFSETVEVADIGVRAVDEQEINESQFAVVALNGQLQLILRNSEGWRVDIIASFAPTLVNRLIEAARVVEANQGDQATSMRAILVAQRPSVAAAAGQPGLPEATRTELLSLLEMLDDLAE
jgi:hypothetical protein